MERHHKIFWLALVAMALAQLIFAFLCLHCDKPQKNLGGWQQDLMMPRNKLTPTSTP